MQSRFSDEEPSEKGPSASGSGSRLCLPDSNVQKGTGPKFLRAVAKKYDIVCTASLVAAYNAAKDDNERAVLLQWLRKYDESKNDCLKPTGVLEYAELAKVVHVSEQDANMLRKLVYGLGSLISPGEFLDEDVAKALFSALTWTDSAVYDDAAQLTDLGLDLLLSLSSRPRLTKHNFLKYEANFLCIHQVFFLLQSIGRGYFLEEEKIEFRRVVAEKREEMKLSLRYYPVSFHFQLIQQAVERLEIENAPSALTQAKRRTIAGLYGGVHVFHFLRKLAGGDIDPSAVEDVYRKSRRAIANAGVSERQWYDLLQILTAARLGALKEETKLELLVSSHDLVMEGHCQIKREEDMKALRYGIILEMRILANTSSCKHVRKEATKKLTEIAINQAVVEDWLHDADVVVALLDALHEIHTFDEDNSETARALKEMQQACADRAKTALTSWLGNDTMENKLQMQRKEVTSKDREDVFLKIGKNVGFLPLSTILTNVEDLEKTYLHDNFAKVSAFLLFLINQDSFFQGVLFA